MQEKLGMMAVIHNISVQSQILHYKIANYRPDFKILAENHLLFSAI